MAHHGLPRLTRLSGPVGLGRSGGSVTGWRHGYGRPLLTDSGWDTLRVTERRPEDDNRLDMRISEVGVEFISSMKLVDKSGTRNHNRKFVGCVIGRRR